jgi:cation diffusion facilitator family transporter
MTSHARALPSEQARAMKGAKRLAWWSIAYVVSVIVIVGLTMGSSQAMKTVWLEDMLSLVPPIAFLVGARVSARDPDRRFPWGRGRASAIAFLCSAVALSALGLYLLSEGVLTLAKQQRPTIGSLAIGGWTLWEGWLMIAALVWSAAPMIVLGRRKSRVAEILYDKGLHTDGEMCRDDWLVAAAAMLGVLGIGLGVWWADAAAAIAISIDVCRDGFRNLRDSIAELMDRRPRTVDHGSEDRVVREVEAAASLLPWARATAVKLRAHGQSIVGDVLVVPRGESPSLAELDDARRRVESLDWRLREISIVPVPRL